MAMEMDMMAPSVGAWLHAGEIQAVIDMILAEGDFTPVEGEEGTWSNAEGATMTKGEDVLTFTQGTKTLDEPVLSGADGDLNLRLHYGALTEMMGAMGGADQATLDAIKDMVIDVELSIDPIGIREKMVSSGVDPAIMGDWSKVAAKRELLESLPADTLWAATSSADQAVIQAWLETPQAQEMLANPGIAQLNMMLAGWGLPDYPTLVGAIGGDHLIYARTSAPIPALTVQIGIEEAVGKQVLTAIANQAGWMDAGDGTDDDLNILGVTTRLSSINGVDDGGGLVLGSGNAWDELTVDDFLKMKGQARYVREGKWYMSSEFFWTCIAGLIMDAGGRTMMETSRGPVLAFLGSPVEITPSMPRTEANSQIACLYGDLRLSSTHGVRKELTIEQDTSVKFIERQVAVLGTQRHALSNHTLGDDTTAGPMVGLITAAS